MRSVLIVLSASLLATPLAYAQSPSIAAPPKIDYYKDVKPILMSRCFSCHGPKQVQSGLRLDLRQFALRGGDYGVVIIPGRADESKLIKRLTGSSAGLQMPPTGELPAHEIETLRAWIDQGADMPGNAFEGEVVRGATDPDLQALIDTIARRDLAAVKRMLAGNADFARGTDSAGSTALMHAAASSTTAIMEAVIDAGADVNAANARRATALHWALPDVEKVNLLLARGAHVDPRTIEGRTPLYIAAMLPQGVAAARRLLAAGAEVDAASLVGTTPLFPAVTTSADMTRLLLDHGANPNARARTGATPILFTRGADVIALLLARGADARARSKTGESSLMEAAIRGDVRAARLLLENGTEVNAADHRGYTPLLLAAQYDGDSVELVRLLLDHGADVNAVAEGETPLSLAAKRGETGVTTLLRTATTTRTSKVRQ